MSASDRDFFQVLLVEILLEVKFSIGVISTRNRECRRVLDMTEGRLVVESDDHRSRVITFNIESTSSSSCLDHRSLLVKNMALPQSLRISVTPPELELISCQQLVEIVPLISMEKTAFISVWYLLFAKPPIYCLNPLIKYIRAHMGPFALQTKLKFLSGWL